MKSFQGLCHEKLVYIIDPCNIVEQTTQTHEQLGRGIHKACADRCIRGGMQSVIRVGSLADCQPAHTQKICCKQQGRQTQPSYVPADKAGCLDSVADEPWKKLQPRPYAAFELPEAVGFRQEVARDVAAMLRSLACRQVEDLREQFRQDNSEVYLAGHVNGTRSAPPRFSYLPLPSIGPEHSDGLIRCLLIAEPFGSDGRGAARAQQRLVNKPLVDNDGNERGLLRNLCRRSLRRIIDKYVRRATTWATVTPVILPGFDDCRWVIAEEQPTGPTRKAERLFMKAVVQAGLRAQLIESFKLRKAPFWPGSAR